MTPGAMNPLPKDKSGREENARDGEENKPRAPFGTGFVAAFAFAGGLLRRTTFRSEMLFRT
eukprot:29989-Pelagococcus_subviridis.AAC.13